eukprot:gene12391-biopygen12886
MLNCLNQSIQVKQALEKEYGDIFQATAALLRTTLISREVTLQSPRTWGIWLFSSQVHATCLQGKAGGAGGGVQSVGFYAEAEQQARRARRRDGRIRAYGQGLAGEEERVTAHSEPPRVPPRHAPGGGIAGLGVDREGSRDTLR